MDRQMDEQVDIWQLCDLISTMWVVADTLVKCKYVNLLSGCKGMSTRPEVRVYAGNGKLWDQTGRQFGCPWGHVTNLCVLRQWGEKWWALFWLRLIRFFSLFLLFFILELILILLDRVPPGTTTLHGKTKKPEQTQLYMYTFTVSIH